MSDMWEYEDDEAFEEHTQPVRLKRHSGINDPRGNLYLLTGLLIGLGIGLLIAWVISPVAYLDTDPGSLAQEYKDAYRQLIALAYSADGNLERARERLILVDTDGSVPQMAAQAQRMLAENQPAQAARALAVLAADLNQPPPAQTAPPAEITDTSAPTERSAVTLSTLEVSAAVQTPTVPLPTRTPTPTLTVVPTFTPRPTATPLRVLDAPFVLKEKREVCDGSVPEGLLQVYVSDAEENPMPGVQITVNWVDGQESFYTGLVPEIGPGYADFVMAAGFIYGVKVGEVSETLDGLSTKTSCGWQLEFTQQK